MNHMFACFRFVLLLLFFLGRRACGRLILNWQPVRWLFLLSHDRKQATSSRSVRNRNVNQMQINKHMHATVDTTKLFWQVFGKPSQFTTYVQNTTCIYVAVFLFVSISYFVSPVECFNDAPRIAGRGAMESNQTGGTNN